MPASPSASTWRATRPRANLSRQRTDAVECVDDGVVLHDRFGRRRHVGHQRPEPQCGEKRVAALARGPAVLEGLGIERDGHVGANRDELAAATCVVGVRQECLSLLLRT